MQETWLQVGPIDDLANVVASLIIGDPELSSRSIAKWRELPRESMKEPANCLFERDDITDRLPSIPTKKNGKRIACVGAGPASLAFAAQLLSLIHISFFGDVKAHGRDAVQFYTQNKTSIQRWW